jgi:methyl-accepting chemotaxis protein
MPTFIRTQDSAQDTAASIEEMVANIRQITESLEQLSASSEEIASSASEVNTTVKEIEHHASESVELSETVLNDASKKGAPAAVASMAARTTARTPSPTS